MRCDGIAGVQTLSRKRIAPVQNVQIIRNRQHPERFTLVPVLADN